ncbi:MAG: hypothetical protein ACPHV3_03895 [Vibrio sp.]
MNIYDFLITVAVSLSIGFLLGYFFRDLTQVIRKKFGYHLVRPKYLQKFTFDDVTDSPDTTKTNQ